MKPYSDLDSNFIALGNGLYAYRNRIVDEELKNKIVALHWSIHRQDAKLVMVAIMAASFRWWGMLASMGLLAAVFWAFVEFRKNSLIRDCPSTDVGPAPLSARDAVLGNMSKPQIWLALTLAAFFLLEIVAVVAINVRYSDAADEFKVGAVTAAISLALAFTAVKIKAMWTSLRDASRGIGA